MKSALLFLFLAAAVAVGAEQPPTVLKGQISEVSGSIRGSETRTYLLQGKKGQTVEISLTSPKANWLVLRLFPSKKAEGADVLSNYISGDIKLTGVLPEDGEYMIFVGIRRAEARRGGNATYKLHVAARNP
jgi:hypothetical protein